MDTPNKGAGPPGGGGRHEKDYSGKPGDSVPAPAPPCQAPPRGHFVAGEILACDLTPAEKLLLGLMATLSVDSGQAYAGVDTYASRLGINRRTVRRLLRDLERRGFIIQDRPGGGREIAALYRLNPLQPCVGKPGQFAPVSAKVNPDKSGRKPGHFVPGNPDKNGQKPGQFTPQEVDEFDHEPEKGGDSKVSPPPTARGPKNGNDNGGHPGETDPAASLLALFKEARCGEVLSPKQAARFREALAESLDAGATANMIAAEIRKADCGTDPWDPPNVAREKARNLLKSYQAAARMPKPRTSVAYILSDLDFARRKLARNPRPDRGDEGAALWRAQIEWADIHAGELAEAAGQPKPAAVGATR